MKQKQLDLMKELNLVIEPIIKKYLEEGSLILLMWFIVVWLKQKRLPCGQKEQ